MSFFHATACQNMLLHLHSHCKHIIQLCSSEQQAEAEKWDEFFFPVLFDHLIALFSVVGNNPSIKKEKKNSF